MDNPTQKEEIEKSIQSAKDQRAKMRERGSEADQKKIDILEGVRRTLEENQIPFWLFAEEPTGRGYEYYTQSNWCPMIFDDEGNLSTAGMDFVANSSMNLFGCVFNVALNALSKMYNVPAVEIEPRHVLHFIGEEARKDFMAVAEHCDFDNQD